MTADVEKESEADIAMFVQYREIRNSLEEKCKKENQHKTFVKETVNL